MDGGSVIGHQSLIAARMAGYKPSDAWLTCLPTEQEYGSFTHPEAQLGRMTNGRWVGYPDIHIHDTENAAALDLRPVVGLVVHILAPRKARAMQLLRRVTVFAPARVIASGAWGIVLWDPAQGLKEFPA